MKKFNFSIKITLLIKIIFFLFALSLKSYSESSKIDNNFVSLGPDKATVKIKIFSSFTCPHCATFHFKVLPQIKKEYVETGKVQLIFIDFPLDEAAFNASKLLHCVDKSRQIKFMDTIYENQNQWTAGTNIDEINISLKKIVKNLGISSSDFEQCLINEDISDKILNGRIDASNKYSINSTPTIVINEKKLQGSVSFKNIKKKNRKTDLVHEIYKT